MSLAAPVRSVSSYCLREQLGPVSIAFTDADGNDQSFGWDHPKLIELADFPAEAANRLGADAVETVAFQFTGLDDPAIDGFGASLRTSGVRLINVAIDLGDLANADADRREADLAVLKQWVDRFAAIGSEFVRVNPGSPFAPHDGGKAPQHLVDALRELGTYAASKGCRLLVENHGGPSSDPAWIADLLDRVGRDACGLLLDLGNFDVVTQPLMAVLFAPAGTAPEPADVFATIDIDSIYADIAALAPRAELVHVKSHFVTAEGVVGAVDLLRALGLLADVGYSGPLTVEYEGSGGDPWANTRAVVGLVDAVINPATAEAVR